MLIEWRSGGRTQKLMGNDIVPWIEVLISKLGGDMELARQLLTPP
jgi:hypothetical protein